MFSLGLRVLVTQVSTEENDGLFGSGIYLYPQTSTMDHGQPCDIDSGDDHHHEFPHTGAQLGGARVPSLSRIGHTIRPDSMSFYFVKEGGG